MFARTRVADFYLKKLRTFRLASLAMAACFALTCGGTTPAQSTETSLYACDGPDHIHRWTDPDKSTRGIVVLIHGLTMHSGAFNTIGQSLASAGFVVYSMDLRGFGARRQDNQTHAERNIDYNGSFNDLTGLQKFVQEKHPGLPVFLIGESLGADLSLRLAAEHSTSISGLILCSPAIKPHAFPISFVKLVVKGFANPTHQLKISKYIERLASDDSHVTQDALTDPLVRKTLSALDLYKSSRTCAKALSYADCVSEQTPVLVMQGRKDKIIKPQAIIKLLSHLKSRDQTVRWFPERGHLLIETAYIQPDTLSTIHEWLDRRLPQQQQNAKLAPEQPQEANLNRETPQEASFLPNDARTQPHLAPGEG